MIRFYDWIFRPSHVLCASIASRNLTAYTMLVVVAQGGVQVTQEFMFSSGTQTENRVRAMQVLDELLDLVQQAEAQ